MSKLIGDLTLVGNHIGNRKDLTLKQLAALRQGKIFFVEDSRKFKKLLSSLHIAPEEKVINSFHDHSPQEIEDKIFTLLQEGHSIYYLADAGSSMINDPAFPLVRRAVQEKITVQSCSGISSVIMAIELGALPANHFSFWGFFPRKHKSAFVAQLPKGLHIFFESPKRILDTVEQIFQESSCQVTILKELTKKYQTIYRLNKFNYLTVMPEINCHGEFVLLLYQAEDRVDNTLQKLATNFLQSKSKKDLSKLLASITKLDNKEIYRKLHDE